MIAEEIPQTWKPSPITMSVDHKYRYGDVWLPGVSGIIECIGATFDGPANYGAKNAALAAVRLAAELPRMIEELGEEGARKALSAKSSWGPDPSGSKLGTEVHKVISQYLQGQPVDTMSAPAKTRYDHFVAWWVESRWTLRLSEAMVVRPAGETGQDGWGGTLDVLAYDVDRRTVLADVKTGNLWPKAIIQVAGYGMASLVQPAEAHEVYPMPDPDRYVILHVTEKGVRLVEVNVGTPERMAFLAALDIWHWTQSMKGIKL